MNTLYKNLQKQVSVESKKKSWYREIKTIMCPLANNVLTTLKLVKNIMI